MDTLIRRVVQESIKDILWPAQAAVSSTSVRPAKGRSKPEARAEGCSDLYISDFSGKGDKPVFDFALVGSFLRTVCQSLEVQEPVSEGTKTTPIFLFWRSSKRSLWQSKLGETGDRLSRIGFLKFTPSGQGH